jgi:hypothetical protein
MKLQKRKWLAVGTLAAFGIGAGSAVAMPVLNAVDRPAGTVVDTSIAPATSPSVERLLSVQRSSSTKATTHADHADSPTTSSSPNTPATPNTPASASSPASADSASSAS